MNISQGNIRLIEDHDQALRVWRNKKIKGLDLVHIDAHIDFGIQPAKPVEKIVNEARSLKELKRNLEYSLAFMCYEKDFDKQTNIGNYIYPAMEEGIVKNFYWVVPGRLKEFKQSTKSIKDILENISKESGEKIEVGTPRKAPSFAKASEDRSLRVRQKSEDKGEGIISTKLKGRDLIVCTLERLPVLRQEVLLDIDTDFLVMDSLLNAANTKNIGKRKPWIMPQELVETLKKKIRHPQIITIAYSVNGGYTPMIYKHLGDEIAYHLAPKEFRGIFKNNYQAAQYFKLFSATEEKEYYRKAIKLNPSYRVADNNYGPLYLSLRKFSLAKEEFSKVLRVDSKNPACLSGLGDIALTRKDFKKAKQYFSSALNIKENPLFAKTKIQALLGLARTEFALKNFKRAKELLIRYQTFEPLQPQSYYLLGHIFEKEKDYAQAVRFYKDTIRLGFGGIEPIARLLKITSHLKEKDDIIKYIITKYKEFKKGFIRTKRLSLKKGKKIKGLRTIEEKMLILEKKLHNNNLTHKGGEKKCHN
jgi:tetratricopeptide (TPR) repeat protein